MKTISAADLEKHLDYPSVIQCLEDAFRGNYTVPPRHHHDYPNPSIGVDSTLLLMPAWEAEGFLGVKLITVSPENSQFQLPSIQGLYFLFDVLQGTPLAQLEAKTLTGIRTAAASALASRYLSRADSSSLLMIGTGAMAPRLITAHCSVRPIKRVWIWGRSHEKASRLSQELALPNVQIEAITDLQAFAQQADIISAATLSASPLLKGVWLRPGQHIDLVGSFKPNMREADDDVILKASLFADVKDMATKESGDFAIPLKEGLLQMTDIQADLFDLCNKRMSGRSDDKQITLFKSVGHALEDLAAAKLAYIRMTE